MQGQITLSKKEKQYQFFYLILMLVFALIFLGIIFLKSFASPFSEADTNALQILEQKVKFDQQQKIGLKLIDTAAARVNRLSVEIQQPVERNDAEYAIQDLANTFQNVVVNDPRKSAFPQIGKFFKMNMIDKDRIMKMNENTKTFEKQYEECQLGYKEKSQTLRDRNNSLNPR
ncbi:type VI secretion system transmembrane protein TssO [Chryseobacterium formosus]|uniref:Type VI secretion system transmembrane protein TssO n=1 Tax=Chryseobacterium formosus TaxID=1537363 RepID=A0ABT3XWJ0_9FLAO|nr:type VI secretion system TssO [Chryseobacterium formosus]MCX8526002.1 type VI secretion system transmembrane protein TssO [Chryseobacterium formosus]